ncbi:MAG: FecR family protein [Candidatus Electryonea clarkiae]|nr:FecR family protein [Candidatus Electryonea clarkiae]MDP8288411.1 FecR family protein [Candidatus Electryonea clarkiae]
MMRIWRKTTILFFLSMVMLTAILFLGAAKSPVGKITFFIGDIRVRPIGQKTWDKASLNHDVYNGYSIRAGKESRVELTLADKSVIRIGENAIFEVENLKMKDGSLSGETKLPFGKMWSKMKKLGADGVKVKSPNAVMAIRGTTFRADAAIDSSLSLWVYEGQVDVNQLSNLQHEEEKQLQPPQQTPVPGGPPVPVQPPDRRPVPGPYQVTLSEWLQITAGMKLNLRSDGMYSHEAFDLDQDKEDNWVGWNMSRDSEIK